MTSSVLITAACGDDHQLVVSVTTANTGNMFTLLDGETAERYVTDEMTIHVRKAPRMPPTEYDKPPPDHNG